MTELLVALGLIAGVVVAHELEFWLGSQPLPSSYTTTGHAYPHNSGGGPRNPRRINQVGRQGQSAASKRFGFDFSCFSTFGPDQWG